MRQPDVEVREVVCSETGKPMAKIPLWMADIKVKFVSDEARQRHPAIPSVADIEPIRRSLAADPELDELKGIGEAIEEEGDFEEIEDVEAEEAAEEEF